MKDVVISAATLAGLVGLACLYNSGSTNQISRVARGADFDDFVDLQDDDAANSDFMTDFGLADDDLQMFQSQEEDTEDYGPDARAGGAKKQISQVKNCMRNPACKRRAHEAIKSWSSNSAQYITSNPGRLLKAVSNSFVEAENDFGLCTPNDDAIHCEEYDNELHFYNAHSNDDSKNFFSTNEHVQNTINDLIAAGESSSLEDAMNGLKADSPKSNGNPFNKRAAKVFLIVPNGVPISMPENYQSTFGNYWRWFKAFNEKYIGVATKENPVARSNFHFWFLRQDKNIKFIMKNPAKVSNKFPWRRFDNILTPNQNTASQPKLTGTFKAMSQVIDSKGMASDANEGLDCMTIWFHQYVPQDVLDLSDSLFQESYMKTIERKCTIIHVWVGMQAVNGDSTSIRVVQYLQGLLQPEQLKSTSQDPQRRRYYFIKDLEALMGSEGNALLDQIYGDIVMERNRVTCLLGSGATDLGAAFEAANDRYDAYYAYANEEEGTTTTYEGGYTADSYQYELDYSYDSSAPAYEAEETTLADVGPPDWKCCGIGFGGKKYNAKTEACCDDGTTAGSEADCFLL